MTLSATIQYTLLKIKRYKISSIITYCIVPVLLFFDKYFTGNFVGKTIVYLGNRVLYASFLIVCYYIGFLWITFILDDILSFDIKERIILYFSGVKNYLIYRFFEDSLNAVFRTLLTFILAIIVLNMSTSFVLLAILLSFVLMMSTTPFTIISYCLALILRKDARTIYRVFHWGIVIVLPFFYSIIIYPKVALWILSILFPPAIFFEAIKQIIFAKLVFDFSLLITASIFTIIWYFIAYLVFRKIWDVVRRRGLLTLV